MADTWTYAAGVWTLALDGSGSGQESRHKDITGLTASTLYTFYSTVNPGTVATEPFIEVDGGDRTTLTATGSHLALVRGTTDGSGNIRLRRGVADASGAPASAGSDSLGYANNAAALAASWTASGGAVFGSTFTVGGFTTSLRFGSLGAVEKTYTVVSGQTYTLRLYADASGADWFNSLALTATSGGNTSGGSGGSEDINGGEAPQHLQASIVASGTSMTVRITGAGNGFHCAGLTIDGLGGTSNVTWTDWDFCIGTGMPQTPPEIIDPVPDPPPGGYPPPPVGGARPFTAYGIPTGGFGYWNGSVKKLKAAFAVNQLNETTSNEVHNFFVFGETSDWLTGGVFDFNKWKAVVDGIANNSTINTLLEAAIADGWAFGHHVIDEPYHPTRYGGPIGIATVERMCLYSKSIWPTWPTLLRVAPTFSWITRKIGGCDWLWAEYLTRRGDCATYRDSNIERASDLGYAGCVMGLHYSQFTGTGGRDITPSELIHYGKIMAAGDPTKVPAFGGWQYKLSWYSQPGAPEAVRQVRDYFAGLDP
jgi:hypothetical protein